MQRKYLYSFITIGFVLFLFGSCASKVATENEAVPVNAISSAENLIKADALFRERQDLAKLREAVRLLAAVRNPGSRSFEIEWKFAKYSCFLGRQSGDEKESEKAFADGAEAGKIASRIEPDKADGYFWYGANLGEQARRSPVTVGIRAVGDIREVMGKVIEIDPAYQGASAYDVLAQIEIKTSLTGGKAEKAVEYLEKGLELEKENTYIRLHLAEAYLAVDRDADAKKQLEYLLKMKPDPEYLFEYEETTEKAKKLLEKKF